MTTTQKIYFFTYGSGQYEQTIHRLREEAEVFGCFSEILIYTDDDMNDEYWKIHEASKKDYNVARGLPRIILINKLLKEINENDIVLYLDAGFEIYKNGIERFQNYIELINSRSDILTMQLKSRDNSLDEKVWTNNYIFNKFNISLDSSIANSPQIESGFIMIRNTSQTRLFFKELKNHIAKDCHLITKKYNSINPHPEFKDSRHEQSLLSIMLKLKFNVNDVSIPDETWPPSLFPTKKLPFLARRSREIINIPFTGNGQINMNNEFGKQIYLICKHYKRNEPKCIVEIGSWNGQGSTICIMNAIHNQPKSSLYSFEADKPFADKAVEYWNSISDTYHNVKNILHIINATLHRQLAPKEDIIKMYGDIPHYEKHYIGEQILLNSAQLYPIKDNISNVDIIILDGGEYTTMEDFNILITYKPKYVILDDTKSFKCNKIKSLLLHGDEYKCIFDSSERNGCAIFESV